MAEVETFHSSCVLVLEKLHFSHMQVCERLPTATFAGSTYDTLLSLLPGGLGSNLTRDVFRAFGIAYDSVSWWCTVAVDMHRTWGLVYQPLPDRASSHLLFVWAAYSMSCVASLQCALHSHGHIAANITQYLSTSPQRCHRLQEVT